MVALAPRPAILSPRQWQKCFDALLICAMIISQLAQALPQPFTGQAADARVQAAPVMPAPFAADALPALDDPPAAITLADTLLQQSWQGHPEVVARRDAYSRHYDLGDGHGVAVVSPAPQNYLADDGTWQPRISRFAAVDGGFMLDHDTLHSSLGRQSSTALLRHSDLLVGWQPQALHALDTNGESLAMLAQPLARRDVQAGAPDATLSADGSQVTYRGHWSDPTLAETFVAAPGSVEQSLILAAPPALAMSSAAGWRTGVMAAWQRAANVLPPLRGIGPQPQWLAFETDLYLFTDATLWVNGKEQYGHFSTAGSGEQRVEIRDAAGATLTLAPVIAYEQADAANQVAGHYEGEWLGDNVWRLRVVTPWAWWADPARTYPAVLDPQIYVQVKQASTVESSSCFILADEPFAAPDCDTLDHISVGEQTHKDDEGNVTGYTAMEAQITFAQLPTLPPGYTISAATLLLDAGVEAPGGIYGDELHLQLLDDGAVLDTHTIAHGVNLNEAVSPPRDCYNNYHNPSCVATAISRTVEVPLPIDLVEGWYAGDNEGFQLRLEPGDSCDEHIASQTNFDGLIIECSLSSEAQPQLVIEYDAPVLGVPAIFSAPVPSYDQDVFARSEHEYELSPQNSPWLAVASRGSGDPTAGTRLNARTDFEVDRTPVLDDPVQGERTNYLVMDNTDGQMTNNLQTWIEVGGWEDNQAADTYLLEQNPAVQLPKPTADGVKVTQGLAHGVMTLYYFDVEPDWNLYISVTAASALEIGLELFPENPGLGKHTQSQFDGQGGGFQMAEPYEQGNDTTLYTLEATTDIAGPEQWALAMTHNYLQCSAGPCAHIDIELIACPNGTYFTEKWGCQSLIYPHSQILNEVGGSPGEVSAAANIPATAHEDVGGVRIFSEGGFDDTPTQGEYGPHANNYDFCTTNENLGMPLLGVTGDGVPVLPNQGGPQRLIAVRQGSVCVTDSGEIELTGGASNKDYGIVTGPSYRHDARIPAPLYDGNVMLYHGDMLSAFGALKPYNNGAMHQGSSAMALVPDQAEDAHVAPWQRPASEPAAWPDMSTTSRIQIDQRSVAGDDQGTIHIANDTPGSSTDLATTATWSIAGNFDTQGFDFAAQTPTTPPDMEMASMGLRFHAPATLITSFDKPDPQQARIEELHLTDATVHQSALMGGAHKPIQAVILPAYHTRLDGVECGERSCLDLRNATDIGRADWEMPDVDAGGPTGSVLLQTAGNLQLFSNDHPDSGLIHTAAANTPASANDISQSFNFKTFSGKVSIGKEVCITKDDPSYEEGVDYPEVTVVHGTTSLALPSLGDGTEGGPGFTGEFKLCQTQLREVKLTFNAFPPGISAGPSGMLIKRIQGIVWINPEFVRIQLNVTFQSADGTTFSNGGATMIIDTRGYFELGGGARLVATFDINGSLKVAWNPLDILQEAELKYRDWLRGYLRLHVWRGQGWQNAYDWLPDNNDFHFTGAIGAELTLKEGRIGEFFGVSLPRHDIVFGVEISFGEFCRNDACTSYEWGVQGKITVLSFTVGMFMGKSSGVDFFVGDKGRVLIDQAFDSAMAAQSDGAATVAAINAVPNGLVSDIGDGNTIDFGDDTAGPCPLTAGVATCTFTVEPDTGEALITVAWSEGTLPTAILRTPDGVAVDGFAPGATPLEVDDALGSPPQAWQMSANGTIQFSLDATGALYTIKNPKAGEWTLELSDLTGDEYYNVLFAANTPPPNLTLTAPDNVQVSGALDIAWNITAAPADAKVELAYVPEDDYNRYVQSISSGDVTSQTRSYVGGTTFAPAVDADAGTYQWQPDGLASGTYYIVARMHHPIYGAIAAFSPGSFTYNDTTPPAPPAGIRLRAQEGVADGLIVSWARSTAPDLSAYEVVYNSPSLDDPSGFIERRLRVVPTNPRLANPDRESTRLVGLLEGTETSVCVRAVDASGNVSDCSASVSGTPQQTPYGLYLKPNLTTLQAQAAGPTLFAQWDAGAGSDGFLVSWGYGCGGAFDGPPADQGQTNLDVGTNTSIGLTGLPPGTYTVAVRGYRAYGGEIKKSIDQIASYSNRLRVVLSDGVDGDGDGLFDDWAEHYGVHGAGEDPDHDGMNNQFERINGTDPTLADSDGDTFSDGEELFAALTDPCDQFSLPDSKETVRLIVEPNEESLRYKVAADQGDSPSQRVRLSATGDAAVHWSATPSAAWIKVTPGSGDDLSSTTDGQSAFVSVNASGMEPGYYEGSVRFTGSRPGKPVYSSPQDVPVRMWVMRYRAETSTIVEGYVFLDANANGVEDAGENVRIGGVTVQAVNKMGAVMQSYLSLVNSGTFVISHLPYAGYTLVAHHPDPDYVVTTPDPLPIQLSQTQPMLTLIKIGMARKPGGATTRDQDHDGIPDQDEDRNKDGKLDNDDTDGDGIPDYRDTDDDGDGVFTRLEGTGDFNNNGIPDYLDKTIAVMRQGGVFLPGITKAATAQAAAVPDAPSAPQSSIYLPLVPNQPATNTVDLPLP